MRETYLFSFTIDPWNKRAVKKKHDDALVDSLFRLVILALFSLSKQEFGVFKIKIQ